MACVKCGGLGRIWKTKDGVSPYMEVCPECKGKGLSTEELCLECRGKGKIWRTKYGIAKSVITCPSCKGTGRA